MDVRKFSVPEMILGRGSLKYAALCAKRLGAQKVFLVSDPGLERGGWVERIAEILEAEKLAWYYFNEVVANPRDHQVKEGAARYTRERCDVVMALGGGSPMDAAKGIAIVASNGGSISDYEGANKIQRPLPPMVFMPSTAGSGADISQFAIITDTRRQVKMSIISRTLVPNISIIDPDVLTTKPNELITAAAIDGLAHAIEAYVSQIAYSLTDNGLGIDADHMNKLFEPFFTTKPLGQGIGIGLSTCYHILQSHGGKITVDSAPGEGAVFTAILPQYSH